MAAMPEEKAKPLLPPSSTATVCSRASRVGFEPLAYSYCPKTSGSSWAKVDAWQMGMLDAPV